MFQMLQDLHLNQELAISLNMYKKCYDICSSQDFLAQGMKSIHSEIIYIKEIF
jgi:hypothetical protein